MGKKISSLINEPTNMALIAVLYGAGLFLMFAPEHNSQGSIFLLFAAISTIFFLARFGFIRFDEFIAKNSFILLAIATPLYVHFLIGLIDLFWAVIKHGFQSFDQNNHLRTYLRIGVRNYSIICIVLIALLSYILASRIFLLRLLALPVFFAIGIANSYNAIAGLFITTFFLYFLSIRSIKYKQLKMLILFGLAVFILGYFISGGINRLNKLYFTYYIAKSETGIVAKSDTVTLIIPSTLKNSTIETSLGDKELDMSAYSRFSLFKLGVKFIANHPLGIGFTTKPIKAVMESQDKSYSHSNLIYDDFHSEIINFGVMFGWVGLLFLFCIFIIFYFYFFMQKKIYSSNFVFLSIQLCFWWYLFFDTVSLGLYVSFFIITFLLFFSYRGIQSGH